MADVADNRSVDTPICLLDDEFELGGNQWTGDNDREATQLGENW